MQKIKLTYLAMRTINIGVKAGNI